MWISFGLIRTPQIAVSLFLRFCVSKPRSTVLEEGVAQFLQRWPAVRLEHHNLKPSDMVPLQIIRRSWHWWMLSYDVANAVWIMTCECMCRISWKKTHQLRFITTSPASPKFGFFFPAFTVPWSLSVQQCWTCFGDRPGIVGLWRCWFLVKREPSVRCWKTTSSFSRDGLASYLWRAMVTSLWIDFKVFAGFPLWSRYHWQACPAKGGTRINTNIIRHLNSIKFSIIESEHPFRSNIAELHQQRWEQRQKRQGLHVPRALVWLLADRSCDSRVAACRGWWSWKHCLLHLHKTVATFSEILTMNISLSMFIIVYLWISLNDVFFFARNKNRWY